MSLQFCWFNYCFKMDNFYILEIYRKRIRVMKVVHY